MSEIPKPAASNALPLSGEVRHNPNFVTVVVGARHEGPNATYRKGELYPDGGLQMSRFLRLTESGTSTGMLVVTRDGEGTLHRFYIMRGAPKGVMADRLQVSITNIDRSVAQSEFETKVSNPEDVASTSIMVGQELVPGAGPVQSILLDTGERVLINQIDTNDAGQSLFSSELGSAQYAMRHVERRSRIS